MIVECGFQLAQRFGTLHGPLCAFQHVVAQDLGNVIALHHVEEERDSAIPAGLADVAKNGVVHSAIHHHQSRVLRLTSRRHTNLDHRIVFHNKSITRLHH